MNLSFPEVPSSPTDVKVDSALNDEKNEETVYKFLQQLRVATPRIRHDLDEEDELKVDGEDIDRSPFTLQIEIPGDELGMGRDFIEKLQRRLDSDLLGGIYFFDPSQFR